MNIWHDITHPKKHHHLRVPHEIFDTTEDVLSWVEHTEKKFQKKHHWFKKIRPFFHFALLTSILFAFLLLVSNWSAYMAFSRAVVAPGKLIETQKSIE
jgi:hypothetical protein